MKQTPVKICITAANGKMGKAVQQQLASNKMDFELVGSLGRNTDESSLSQQYQQLSQLPQKPDVIIDFSRPEFALKIAAQASESRVALVSGTTGFSTEQLQQLENLSKHIPILWAANMSLGVNLALELVELAAKVLGSKAQVEINETHHQHKVDAPSGTALALGKKIASVRAKPLSQLISFNAEQPIAQHPPDKIGFNVSRQGEVIGEHAVRFSVADEQLTIEHKATDRRVFATGALHAAQWLADREAGWYQMTDVMDIHKHLQSNFIQQ